MKRLAFVLLLSPLWCGAGTVIRDTIYTGFPPQVFEGRVTISGPPMTTQDGRMISRWSRDFQISNGIIEVELEPNDTARPAGTSYYVVYRPKSGMAWSEYWVVPTSGSPLKIADVRVSQTPTPQIVVPWLALSGVPETFPPASHSHAASEITAGVFEAARIPSLSGDVAGSIESTVVSKIQGRAVASTPPSDGQALTWDQAGNRWVPQTPPSGGGSSAVVDLSVVHLKDEFAPGASAGVAVAGELSWTVQGSGYTLESTSGTIGAIGAIGLAPVGPANSYAAIHLGGYGMDAKWFSASSSRWEAWWRVKTDHYEVGELEYRLGFTDGWGPSAPNNGIFIRFRNNTGCALAGADSGWAYEARANGSSTVAPSGISVAPGTWYTFRIRQLESGRVRFSGCSGPPTCTLGDEVEITTNIPAAYLTPILQSVTCTSGYRKLFVDRFEAIISQ